MKNHKTASAIILVLLVVVLLEALILGGGFLYRLRSADVSAAEAAAPTSAPDAAADAGPTPEPSPSPTAEPTPEPTPEPTSEPTPEPYAYRLLGEMSLREKVCQMLIVRPTDLDPQTVGTVEPAIGDALAAYPVGGLFYSTVNMRSQEQVRQLLADTQAYSAIPLLTMCDEEGGVTARLMQTVGTTWVDSMLNYKDDGTDTAYENARTIGTDMSGLGFNLDLAPVADVWSNPANTVIGTRAYSDDFSQAAELVASAVEGFHDGGVACTLKHFPGHGDTAEDSHYGAAYVYKTLDQLREEELLPFKAGIDAGADAVMVGHMTVVEVSEEPALFSYDLITGILREELGFDGVVMTDSLEMQALSDSYPEGETVVRAVQAGVDMLLCPADPAGAVEALCSAVEEGRISEERIDESVLRILILKEARGLLE